MCRGTVEESLGRRTLLRCVLADLETLNQNTLKKQTIEHLLYPQTSDNGFFWNEKKKKDKVKIIYFSCLGKPMNAVFF